MTSLNRLRALARQWLHTNENFPPRVLPRPSPLTDVQFAELRSLAEVAVAEARAAAKARHESRAYALGKIADAFGFGVPAGSRETEALLVALHINLVIP